MKCAGMERPFLKTVAEDLYKRFSEKEEGLEGVTVVFPNRRAKLFFERYLTECAGSVPIWAPAYTTIDELFESRTELTVADPLLLVWRLHEVYSRHLQDAESMDTFWPWGEILLRDFEDLDANLADAERLFSSVAELKKVESDLSFLTQEQREALEQYFNFMERTQHGQTEESVKSGEKGITRRYLQLWNVMGKIYREFREELKGEGLAYPSLIQREVVTQLENMSEAFPSNCYAFVGFNRLSGAEKRLFTHLKQSGKALFYWDCDSSYLEPGHEQGMFISENLKRFPNAIQESAFESSADSPSKQCKMEIIETKQNVSQVKYLSHWLDENHIKDDSSTAVVLCDGRLLTPLLHSIPPQVGSVNVTMGYPLRETTLYMRFSAELEKFRKLCINEGSIDNIKILSQLNEWVTETLPTIKEETGESRPLFIPLNEEAAYRIVTHINRLMSLIEDYSLSLESLTLLRLVKQILFTSSIPFHGEPLEGMQVMGLIETRNMDFENVLLLSAGEGTLPKGAVEASLIPYSLRAAFGLTTMREKSAMEAYNFYHLIQRASNVTMLYNGNTDVKGMGKGQISRYLLQLLVSHGESIGFRQLAHTDVPHTAVEGINRIEKTPFIRRRLNSLYNTEVKPDSYLSPSALNCYMECPLKFALRYLIGIKPEENLKEVIEPSTFGTLFHAAAEKAYIYLSGLSKGVVSESIIKTLLSDRKRLEGFVEEAFTENVFNGRKVPQSEYTADQTINFRVILKYLKQLLNYDMTYAPFNYLGGESKDYKYSVTVPNPLAGEEAGRPQSMRVNLKGIIDRIDCKDNGKDNVYRIVDYKTGRKKDDKLKYDLECAFSTEKHNSHAFQVFYYAYIYAMHGGNSSKKITPELIYTTATHSPENACQKCCFLPGSQPKPKYETVTDFTGQVMDGFKESLDKLLERLFSPSSPETAFCGTSHVESCKWCDYVSICQRK